MGRMFGAWSMPGCASAPTGPGAMGLPDLYHHAFPTDLVMY
ncbi:MAG: hypothetical protein O3A51_08270 [Verrucomicrobia bacterium]|nr:hypothetical protein [Verrucomicrobiota bacterium]